MFGICSVVCFLLSRWHAGFYIHLWMLNHWGFAPLQPFAAYLWQAYVQPGDGHWPIPCMHRVAAPSTVLSSNYMVGHTALGAWQKVNKSLCLPCMVGRGLLFQVWFHLMTWSALNLQWALNLVILV